MIFRSLTRRLIFISALLLASFAGLIAASYSLTSEMEQEFLRMALASRMNSGLFRFSNALHETFETGTPAGRPLPARVAMEMEEFERNAKALRDGNAADLLEPLQYKEALATLDHIIETWNRRVRPFVAQLQDAGVTGELHIAFHEQISSLVVPDLQKLGSFLEADYHRELRLYGTLRIVSLLFFVGCAGFIIMYARRNIVRPLRGLQMAVGELEQGRFDVAVSSRGVDEISALARGLDKTTTRLKQAFDEERSHASDLLALSNASRTFMRAGSMEELYQEICDQALRIFGVRMAWLGVIRSSGGELSMVARSGDDTNYADTIGPACAAAPGGAGPAGNAVRTGMPEVISVETDRDAYEVWLQSAASHGFAASLAVPLAGVEGRTAGALTLYSCEEDYFSRDRIERCQLFASLAAAAIEKVRVLEGLEENVRDRTRQLEDARLLAESANRAKSAFLQNMSHDLRTPLNAIIGFSDALVSGVYGELQAKHREYVGDILKSGLRLLDMVNEILDLSRIETGSLQPEYQECSVRDLLNSSAMMFREKARKHGVIMGLRCDDMLRSAVLDESKIKQALIALLTSALERTPDNGSISLEAEPAARDIGESAPRSGILFSVSDTGASLGADAQGIFAPELSAEKRKGAGLGLVLGARFVELHGGAIRSASPNGVFVNRIEFWLPLEPIRGNLEKSAS